MWTYWKCVGDDDEITVVYRTHGDGFGAIDMQVWWPRDRRWHVLPYDNSLRRTIWFGSNSIESATGAEVVGFGADVDDATAEPAADLDLEPADGLKAAYAKALPLAWPLRHENETAALMVAEAERLGIRMPDDSADDPA